MHWLHEFDLTQGWVDAGQGWQGKESTLQLPRSQGSEAVTASHHLDMAPAAVAQTEPIEQVGKGRAAHALSSM